MLNGTRPALTSSETFAKNKNTLEWVASGLDCHCVSLYEFNLHIIDFLYNSVCIFFVSVFVQVN